MMKAKQIHRARNYGRQAGKRRRKKLLAWMLAGILLLLVGAVWFNKDKSMSSEGTVPVQSSILKDAQLAWPETGQAAVGTVDDGLLARSADIQKPQPIASMAKVITALAIMEKQPFGLDEAGQTYTINKDDVVSLSEYVAEDGSVLPLLIGMEISQYQAMQRMLIASDNNMADILAERVFGSAEAYTAYAQDMLQRMGLSQTVVADASGFSPDTVSTPAEMVMLGIAALKNPVIAEIVGQSQAELPVIGTIQNTNQILGVDGVVGLKTGTTDEAGSCLLFAARYTDDDGQEITIVGVVMGAKNTEDRFSDSLELLASVKKGLGLIDTSSADIGTPTLEQRGRTLR